MRYHDHLGRVLAHPPIDPALVRMPSLVIPPDLDLRSYQSILVSISGGADSWLALKLTTEAARQAGVLDRVQTVFADLGDQDEWPGTRELAAEHAASFKVPHHVVFRQIPDHESVPRQQGLLEHIAGRHQQSWPLPNQPYCRSAMKRDPIKKLKTHIADQHRRQGAVDGPVRILEVMGIRAQESAPRRKQSPFCHRASDSNSHRHVDLWLPAHHHTEQERWAAIDHADARWHWIYLFLPRLSCRFCIVAPRAQLVTAARLDPAGARDRAELSDRMGHDFKHGLSMSEILAEAESLGPIDLSALTSQQRAEVNLLHRRAA